MTPDGVKRIYSYICMAGHKFYTNWTSFNTTKPGPWRQLYQHQAYWEMNAWLLWWKYTYLPLLWRQKDGQVIENVSVFVYCCC